ncbi:hypothetical protein ROZALSC1DRAFT_25004 [Rozella allomycis CSF55]|nr:hypothetical protein ROZALSC1DRAFT_25004 [Rozella allomycis CSF55]
MNYARPTPSGKVVNLSLVANPSHLEAVDPVVLGKTRALQFYKKDEPGREKCLSVLLHGDAAFAAQGVVYETLGMSQLPMYTTGGTIHIIVNNQIGFTTDPRFARSTPYCSDVAKSIDAPIFHVNGDDVEAVVYVCKLAAEWRQEFKQDVVVDIVCYRRHGHNEFDEPMFTQPRMYKEIGKKKRAFDLYVDDLIKNKVFEKSLVEEHKKKVWKILEDSYEKSKSYLPTSREWVSSAWNGFKSPKEMAEYISPAYDTGVDIDTLKHIGEKLTLIPKDFNAHRGLARIIETKRKTIETGQGIDMSTAESLAFGSLLIQGNHIRLSGQDVERGTFSQRHAVLNDQVTEKQYIPLSNLSPNQAEFVVCNSSLSEYGVLGFELGYSLVDPRCLILWEAQFGDFCNNAQCIIDQFIASGEKKWLQRTGLTLLLPHGYDGAGPEHSSGRMERFLQLCDDNPFVFPEMSKEKCRQIQDCNFQVVYCSTPANYFHVLRRQILRDFRKPLIVFNSKNLLRNPLAKSSLDEFSTGNRFVRMYPEPLKLDKVDRLVFCSGQVFYALLKARDQNKIKNVAIARIEQISPFPFDLVLNEINKYPNASIIWCQEEPLNMGAWNYVDQRFKTTFSKSKAHAKSPITVVARPPNSAVATGIKSLHIQEEQNILAEALLGEAVQPKDVVNGVPIW